MPRADVIPGSPEEWLLRARSDLALARVALPEGGLLEDLCYHAQQAAEKAIKALYRNYGWPFRYVHVIEELLSGLKQQGVDVPDDVMGAIILTDYATTGRYPGREEPVTPEEYAEAVALAETALAWATDIVEWDPTRPAAGDGP